MKRTTPSIGPFFAPEPSPAPRIAGLPEGITTPPEGHAPASWSWEYRTPVSGPQLEPPAGFHGFGFLAQDPNCPF